MLSCIKSFNSVQIQQIGIVLFYSLQNALWYWHVIQLRLSRVVYLVLLLVLFNTCNANSLKFIHIKYSSAASNRNEYKEYFLGVKAAGA
jgi:hypothetical protein